MGVSAVIKGVVIAVLVIVLGATIGYVAATLSTLSAAGSTSVTGFQDEQAAGDVGMIASPAVVASEVVGSLFGSSVYDPVGGVSVVAILTTTLGAIAAITVGWWVFKLVLRLAAGGW